MPILLGIIAALGYGAADFLARFSSERIGVRGALLGTLVSGALAMTLWFALSGVDPRTLLSALPWLVLAGLLSAAALALLYAALQRGPVSIASPVVALHPALVLLLLVAGDLRPGAQEWLGLAITLLGAVLLSSQIDGVGAAQQLPRAHVRRTAALAAVCAVIVALQVLSVQQAARVAGPIGSAWGSRVFALAALLCVLPFGTALKRRPRSAWGIAVVQGLLDAGAVLAVAAGSTGTDRAIVPVIGSTFSAVTVGLARIVLKERMTGVQWAAIAVILIGVAVLGARG